MKKNRSNLLFRLIACAVASLGVPIITAYLLQYYYFEFTPAIPAGIFEGLLQTSSITTGLVVIIAFYLVGKAESQELAASEAYLTMSNFLRETYLSKAEQRRRELVDTIDLAKAKVEFDKWVKQASESLNIMKTELTGLQDDIVDLLHSFKKLAMIMTVWLFGIGGFAIYLSLSGLYWQIDQNNDTPVVRLGVITGAIVFQVTMIFFIWFDQDARFNRVTKLIVRLHDSTWADPRLQGRAFFD